MSVVQDNVHGQDVATGTGGAHCLCFQEDSSHRFQASLPAQ